MKIRRATVNQKKSQIELVTYSGRTYPMPLSRLSPTPSPTNQLVSAQVDPELDREAVTFVLESGEEGVLHIDQALDYNRDPGYLAEMLTQGSGMGVVDCVKAQKDYPNAAPGTKRLAQRLMEFEEDNRVRLEQFL